ncbi:restriction endonuclease subunit S [Vibrio campbellii]
MGSEWKVRLLGDLCTEITVGFVGSMTQEYVESGVPFLRSKNIAEYNVDWNDMKFVSNEFHQKLSKSSLKAGDVAIVRTGKPGTTCVIPESIKEANCSDIVIARVNKEILNPHYLAYFMNAMAHGQVNAHVVGAVQQHFNVGSAKKIEIPLPALAQQNKIVDVLKALDDKHRVNTQINQTLEQMAQTLFKSWFVDFDPVIDNALDAGNPIPEVFESRVERRKAVRESADFKPLPDDVRRLFPSEFEESELGWLPKGWRTSNVGKEFDVTMGQSPPGSTYNEIGNGTPFFQGKADFEFRFPNNRVYCTEPKRLANKRDTLISVRAPVGTINLASQDCAIGRGLAAVRHVSGSPSYTYYSMWNLGKHFEVFEGEGTVFGSINQKDFKALPQNQIPSNVVAKFDELSTVWDKKIELGSQQIQELTKLRDILLPKLISGELCLDSPEFEQAKALVE